VFPDAGAKPQEKSGSYESFHAHNDIATVAIFAPKGTQRVLTRKSPRVSERVSLTPEFQACCAGVERGGRGRESYR